MRVGQLPHLIKLKLGRVGPGDFRERTVATFQIRGGTSPGRSSWRTGPVARRRALAAIGVPNSENPGDEFPRHRPSPSTMQCMVAGDAQVAQMRRGLLPYCVLAMLRDTERYGFELVQALGKVDGMVTGQGTIYPLLSRLRRQGLVGTTWRESAAGPPRRYYQLTEAGRTALADFTRDWTQLRDSVDTLLGP